MIPSSTRMWLGSAALSGLLLASSLPALASTQTPASSVSLSLKPVLLASKIIQTGSFPLSVHEQMQWMPNPVNVGVIAETVALSGKPAETASNAVAVADIQTTQSTTVVQPAKKATSKPVQIAAKPQQQVSRSSSSNIVNNALSLRGVPYLYGGTTRKGFDCSAFVQYVFKGSGISLPRTSYEQFGVGSSVSREQLQAGDLLFFHTTTTGASHVGIYIGGGSFVHASNSGVTVSSLSESYYSKRYLGARRVQ